MNSLISIIIPTYNRSDLLGATLDSILKQSYPNWECLLIDDGSSDYTIELLNFYCEMDSRIQFYKRPANLIRGANSCRNFGFKKSQGSYINWFDSDDLMHPDFLAKKLDKLKNLEAICSICSLQKFEFKNGLVKLKKVSKLDNGNIFENIVIQKFAIPTHGPLWRRSYLEERTLFNEDLTISQDLEFHSRMFYNNPVVEIIKEPLYYLREGHTNITSGLYSKDQKYFKSYFMVRKLILDRYSNNSIIFNYYLSELLGIFRFLLTIKEFKNANETLLFVKKKLRPLSSKEKIDFIRIKILFKLIKLTGKGETRYKKYLYLSPQSKLNKVKV